MTLTLWLTDQHADDIAQHAQSDAPREACGLIVGQGSRAVRVIPVKNIALDPLHNYVMDTTELARILPAIHREGLELIGLYHSHPASDPIPSPTDIAQATYPRTPYLIIGLQSGEAKFAAWEMTAGRVYPVNLHIGSNPPDSGDDVPPLSDAGRFAVIGAALLALISLIALSLTLLPAPPAIP